MSSEPVAGSSGQGVTVTHSKGTTYVVFLLDVSGPGWVVVGEAIATSGPLAIRAHLDKVPEPRSGKYAAVPARSWLPIDVTVEQTVTVKLG